MERRIQRLESSLGARYRDAFRAPSWHGPTSLQRLVWQDAETLALLADAAAVTAIMHRHHIGSERTLGATMTLGNALVGGLARMRPSYLLTVCPNWKLRPHAPGLSFDRLSDMRLPDREQPEPFLVTAGFLDAAARAIDSVQQVLVENPRLVAQDDDGVWEAIAKASTRSLYGALCALLSPNRATRLVAGRASTTLRRMSGQCLEVMQYIDRLLALHGGSHERVLGFGLVSHALDAKHLAAALVHCVQLGHTRFRRVNSDAASRTLIRLLTDAARGAMGKAAVALMRARLQQVMRLLSDHRGPLGLSADDLRQALAASDPPALPQL